MHTKAILFILAFVPCFTFAQSITYPAIGNSSIREVATNHITISAGSLPDFEAKKTAKTNSADMQKITYHDGAKFFIGTTQLSCDKAVYIDAKKELHAYNVRLLNNDLLPDIKGQDFVYSDITKQASLQGNVTIIKNGTSLEIGNIAKLDLSDNKCRIEELN